ncbi:STAS domain-containing protein [Zunongwangia endophytica]|uniref:STAS domain-containing protein n=1 Tax=Zunongwangia endophytica TaxID=1808945 RepID=A0ABV8H7G4_9FLAO|nr:STAS domain-containing protein [Zunongwangia endophytica]MDN3593724.1 STAS domain-containing protein [Zunongwangia endophytica]
MNVINEIKAIKISGILNAYTIKKIENELISGIEEAVDHLKIDINQVTEIDVTAAFTLYTLKEKAKDLGKLISIEKNDCIALEKLKEYKLERLL